MKALIAMCLTLAATCSHASWDDMATAAATGYCLANHPYRTIHRGNQYTPDGYEIVSAPGIVGAVRRNFVYKRTNLSKDEGQGNSCDMACEEFGKIYGSRLIGVPLTQEVNGGHIINSGIGDMASLTQNDQDFYLKKTVTAGIWSRGNTWHESDVAQADFCCCQVVNY